MSTRACCGTRSDSTHARDCQKARLAPDYFVLVVPLVQHAIGKCTACGSTICESPLPHDCSPVSFGVGDYGRCLL